MLFFFSTLKYYSLVRLITILIGHSKVYIGSNVHKCNFSSTICLQLFACKWVEILKLLQFNIFFSFIKKFHDNLRIQ